MTTNSIAIVRGQRVEAILAAAMNGDYTRQMLRRGSYEVCKIGRNS